MRQVLTNLIGNAIKFTQTGEIVVRVTDSRGRPATTRVVRFEVTDTGDGIAPDKLALDLPAVRPGRHVHLPAGTAAPGSGLAISSQLVALMGGDCGVSSAARRRAARFWFTISVRRRRRRSRRTSLLRPTPTSPG